VGKRASEDGTACPDVDGIGLVTWSHAPKTCAKRGALAQGVNHSSSMRGVTVETKQTG
jgi:hypothetical protein